MQSGIHRGHYGQDKKLAHKGALRGVETDLCNQRVITAGADDKLKFWKFKAGLYFFDKSKLYIVESLNYLPTSHCDNYL